MCVLYGWACVGMQVCRHSRRCKCSHSRSCIYTYIFGEAEFLVLSWQTYSSLLVLMLVGYAYVPVAGSDSSGMPGEKLDQSKIEHIG